jgi:hypothetical protein
MRASLTRLSRTAASSGEPKQSVPGSSTSSPASSAIAAASSASAATWWYSASWRIAK